MSHWNRRQILEASLAIPLLSWVGSAALAQTARTRYSVATTKGKKMLAILAKGVQQMKGLGDDDPRSWTFQWYTHAVRDDVTKSHEISRVFGTGSSTHKTLATDMWSTCRAHFSTADTPYFLPWHRLFVLHFEDIVRKITGETTFTLPYWNYSTKTASQHGKLPLQARSATSVKYGALYRSDRNPGVNQGQPIDAADPGSLDLDVLSESRYLRGAGSSGFTEHIDSAPHGVVHVQVGDPTNMGSIPWAARDPVFWLHHCNIDRIWASWNKNGGKNPTGNWLKESFVFADASGTRVSGKVGDVVDIGALNYTYDHFEPKPAGFVPAGAGPAAPEGEVAAERDSVSLESAGTPVALAHPAGPAAPTKGLKQRVTELAPGRQLYLTLDHLTSEQAPGVTYRVYLDLPEQPSESQLKAHYVGTIHFFGAVGRPKPSSPEELAQPGVRASLNITKVAKALAAAGTLHDPPSVTFRAVGTAKAGANAQVGQIRIIEE